MGKKGGALKARKLISCLQGKELGRGPLRTSFCSSSLQQPHLSTGVPVSSRLPLLGLCGLLSCRCTEARECTCKELRICSLETPAG